MHFNSFLELLVEEKVLCSKLQDIDNFLGGIDQAVADGCTDKEARGPLVESLFARRDKLSSQLYALRVGIGTRLMDYQGVAERAIAAELERATAAGEDGGDYV